MSQFELTLKFLGPTYGRAGVITIEAETPDQAYNIMSTHLTTEKWVELDDGTCYQTERLSHKSFDIRRVKEEDDRTR